MAAITPSRPRHDDSGWSMMMMKSTSGAGLKWGRADLMNCKRLRTTSAAGAEDE